MTKIQELTLDRLLEFHKEQVDAAHQLLTSCPHMLSDVSVIRSEMYLHESYVVLLESFKPTH